VSKFSCTCGHVIRDQTDYLPYKGQVLKDQDHEAFFASTADALVEYLAGVRSGDLTEWQRKWPFLCGKTDEHVAWSLMGWFWRKSPWTCTSANSAGGCGYKKGLSHSGSSPSSQRMHRPAARSSRRRLARHGGVNLQQEVVRSADRKTSPRLLGRG
jgi:hypothetical protein